jgi:hypothetical protein
MKDLIEALQIFLKYRNDEFPTHCEHDVMMIMDVEKYEVTEEDAKRLDELGFCWVDEYDCWGSYRFGSA